jgi:subtilisin family serine protease
VDRRTRFGATITATTADPTDPEIGGDITGPLDGYLDAASGHGTFIAGIIRQVSPEADIVSFQIADSQGTVLESDLLDALDALLDLLATPVADGGLEVDVLNLSLGFFHETPEDGLFERSLLDRLIALRSQGVAVVCSAGNAATERPSFPAALWAWDDPEFHVDDPADAAPHVSVGALNPNGTVALFSNIGRWVRCYAPGVGVVSTSPPFRGGIQAGTRDDVGDLRRETLDPDDFSAGFAVWSGTSFAAPYVAARLAAAITADTMAGAAAVAGKARADALRKALADLEPELAKLRDDLEVTEP